MHTFWGYVKILTRNPLCYSATSPTAACGPLAPILECPCPSTRLGQCGLHLLLLKLAGKCLNRIFSARASFDEPKPMATPCPLLPPVTPSRLFRTALLPLNALGNVGCAWFCWNQSGNGLVCNIQATAIFWLATINQTQQRPLPSPVARRHPFRTAPLPLHTLGDAGCAWLCSNQSGEGLST